MFILKILILVKIWIYYHGFKSTCEREGELKIKFKKKKARNRKRDGEFLKKEKTREGEEQ
jgi:hypothetical protein